MGHISKVLSADIKILKSNPIQLSITALGQVGSLYWSHGRLDPRIYIDFPADGIQDFDFNATPPLCPSPSVVSLISAGEIWPDPPAELRGVRIHAAANFIEVPLTGSAEYPL